MDPYLLKTCEMLIVSCEPCKFNIHDLRNQLNILSCKNLPLYGIDIMQSYRALPCCPETQQLAYWQQCWVVCGDHLGTVDTHLLSRVSHTCMHVHNTDRQTDTYTTDKQTHTTDKQTDTPHTTQILTIDTYIQQTNTQTDRQTHTHTTDRHRHTHNRQTNTRNRQTDRHTTYNTNPNHRHIHIHA